MKWIYYITFFGPGHQSREDGFIEVSDSYNEDSLREQVREVVHENYPDSDHRYFYWEVEKLPPRYVEERLSNIARQIEILQEEFDSLSEATTSVDTHSESNTGNNYALQNVLRDLPTGCQATADTIKTLHDSGIIVMENDFCGWKRGYLYPTNPEVVDSVLDIFSDEDAMLDEE